MAKWWIMVPLIAFAGLALSIGMAETAEPSYQGRTLTKWLDDFDPSIFYPEGPPEVEAIRHIGTNAIPKVLEWLDAGQTERAIRVCGILREQAGPVVPELTHRALITSDRAEALRCMDALSEIGSASIPSFSAFLTNDRPIIRVLALCAMDGWGTNGVQILPAIMKCLVDENEDVGGRAAGTLAELKIPDSAFVPALTNLLTTASTKVKLRVYHCFFYMATRPPGDGEALHLIQAALQNPNPEIANYASNASEGIESFQNIIRRLNTPEQ
jgi:hypothetical protein